MATIGQYLSLITNAVYGEEVRSAIVNAIQQCYTDATDVVKVSETEPTSENTRIWIKPTTDECKVPTWEEFQEAVSNTDDLKSALTQLRPFETQAQLSWIDGKYINTHGNESGNANHKCTSFIALNPNSKYTTNLSVFWALYDETKTYIPGSWRSAVVDLTTDNSIRYIRFSIEKSAETEPVVLSHTNNVVDELQTDINVIETELVANRQRIAVLSGITYTVGKLISNMDGEVYDNADYSANTDYIELPFKSGKFTFPVTEKHGVVSLAFYDSNKVFISAYQQEGNEFDYIEVNIPSNAVYFRNTLTNEDVQNQPYYDCVFINDKTFSALFDDTQKNIKDVEFSKVISNMTYRSGHLVFYTNGEDYSETSSSANYSATDFIKLPPMRDKLFFPLLAGMSGNGGLAFYDTEQKYITGYKGTADMRSVVLTELTIPDNAVYFKNCIYTSLLPNYDVCNNVYLSTEQIANLVTWDMREKFFKDRFVLHVGTSISDSRNGIPCTWFAQAMKMVGCENYQNSARSGKGPQYHAENYNTLIQPYIGNAYLFTIEHGQNNATTNLGTVDNMTPDSQGNYDITTWYGAMAYIITRARSENMFVKIALIGSWHTGIFPHQQNVANFFNLPLLDMCKMIGCSNQEVTTTITLSNGETLSGTKTIRNWFATYINANGELVEGETESPDGGIHPYNPDAQKKYATCYANFITSI